MRVEVVFASGSGPGSSRTTAQEAPCPAGSGQKSTALDRRVCSWTPTLRLRLGPTSADRLREMRSNLIHPSLLLARPFRSLGALCSPLREAPRPTSPVKQVRLHRPRGAGSVDSLHYLIAHQRSVLLHSSSPRLRPLSAPALALSGHSAGGTPAEEAVRARCQAPSSLHEPGASCSWGASARSMLLNSNPNQIIPTKNTRPSNGGDNGGCGKRRGCATQAVQLAAAVSFCFGLVLGNLVLRTHGGCVIYPSETFDAVAVGFASIGKKWTVLHDVPTMLRGCSPLPHARPATSYELRGRR